MDTFKAGDHVAVIDENLSGVVISVTVNELSVETEDGFTMQFSPKEVVKIDKNLRFSSVGGIQKQLDYKLEQELHKSRQPIPRKKEKLQAAVSFDLHIEKLAKNHKRMQTFEIMELQLETAKRHLEFAIKNKIPKIVLIHGVGEGVLKAELEYLYRRYSGISVTPADFRIYGQGATQIFISQKASLQ